MRSTRPGQGFFQNTYLQNLQTTFIQNVLSCTPYHPDEKNLRTFCKNLIVNLDKNKDIPISQTQDLSNFIKEIMHLKKDQQIILKTTAENLPQPILKEFKREKLLLLGFVWANEQKLNTEKSLAMAGKMLGLKDTGINVDNFLKKLADLKKDIKEYKVSEGRYNELVTLLKSNLEEPQYQLFRLNEWATARGWKDSDRENFVRSVYPILQDKQLADPAKEAKIAQAMQSLNWPDAVAQEFLKSFPEVEYKGPVSKL